MWLFCEAGFFSIVDKDCPPDCLLIRARSREDLEALSRAHPLALGPIRLTPDHDYAYRAIVSREDLAGILATMVNKIDYGNFKARVHQIDPSRMSAYHAVWRAMSDWQGRQRGARRRPKVFEEEADWWERRDEPQTPPAMSRLPT